MKKISLLLLMIIMMSSTCENIVKDIQETSTDGDIAYIWKGFEHSWEEKVHRVGRLGNWIENSNSSFPKEISLNNSAQSGSAKDNANVTTKYSIVNTGDTKFHSGQERIRISTQERKVRKFSERVEINRTTSNRLSGKNNVEVILSGFDLQKRGVIGPDKLGILEINIKNVQSNQNSIIFDIKGELMMSCQSAECTDKILSERVEYNLDIFYLVIASTDENFQAVRHTPVSKEFNYNSATGTSSPPSEETFSLGDAINPAFKVRTKTLSIRGFRFEVDKVSNVLSPDVVPHLYNWNMWLDYPENFDYSTPEALGILDFSHQSSFDNLAHIGHVLIDVKPVSLLFKSGAMLNCSYSRQLDFGNSGTGQTLYKKKKEIKGLLDGDCL